MEKGNRITGGGVQSVTNFSSSSSSSSYHHRYHHYHQALDGVMRGKMLFTATQWQELEMQTVIYKYIMASIPVPPHLLLPLSTQSNRLSIGLRFSNGVDPEPWRCRRTDGKKWRCSKDVAPDQKYCERHARKTRSRSRKPVETQSHNTKDCPAVLSAANQQTKCNDWFMKNVSTPMYQSPIAGSNSKQECSLTLSMQSGRNEMEFDDESFQVAVGMLSGDRDWLNQGSWASLGSVSSSGSTPGGPLGEALCLGITSTRDEPSSHGYSYSTTTSSSCEGDGGGLNFVNRRDG